MSDSFEYRPQCNISSTLTLEKNYMTLSKAKAYALKLANCIGFCVENNKKPIDGKEYLCHFKGGNTSEIAFFKEDGMKKWHTYLWNESKNKETEEKKQAATEPTVVSEPGPMSAFSRNPFETEMRSTAKIIATRGKGILAADESTGTIGKRLAMINVPNEESNRQKYRELLFTTPGIGEYICGAILFEETLHQKARNGTPFVDVLKKQGVIIGIKVDKGSRDLQGCPGEKWTQGLSDLAVRAKQYYAAGARFAKWRAVLVINNGYMSETAIRENALGLARYAAICQANGLVPIVEPEILMDGDHSLQVNQYWTEKVLAACYKALSDNGVLLECSLLKPNMCLPGKQYTGKKTMDANAAATVTALMRSVPIAVPGIMFLSGGQSEEEATMNLNAINKNRDLPWSASFSYGRALQQSCLKAWNGEDGNVKAAQDALLVRAKANSEAQLGKYSGDAATKDSKKTLYEKGYTY